MLEIYSEPLNIKVQSTTVSLNSRLFKRQRIKISIFYSSLNRYYQNEKQYSSRSTKYS